VTLKSKALISGAVVALAFLAGRHSVEVKTVKKAEANITQKGSEQKHEVKNVKTTKKPDGTVEVLDTSTLDTFLQSASESNSKSSETVTPVNSVLVQALAAYQDGHFIYGAAASKKLIGPVTVGLFGFTDLRVGVSVGLEL